MELIDKAAVVAEINKRIMDAPIDCYGHQRVWAYNDVKNILDTLEVKEPYEQSVQYDSIKSGIQAHAETYSFNIESMLFNQLTKEQQELWRKEIEQACISGGEVGVGLARDTRYKENLEVKEVDLEKNINDYFKDWKFDDELDIMVKPNNYSASFTDLKEIAKHFFELGIKAVQKGD